MNEALEWCVVVWNFADSQAAGKPIDWGTVVISLISGLIGISGSWLALGWQAGRENRSVRAAILAEVGALLDLAELQKYRTQARDAADSSSRGFNTTLKLGIPEHFNQVYLANAPKLGVLREDGVRKVVRFYQLMDSVRADTSEGGRLIDGTAEKSAYKATLKILEEALGIGEVLVAR
ncbi:MAG: hypothetical protein LBE53_17050 [Paucimonas sp.]|jgi:hypothetical protein|nr:hypothetical protein [Paucimonas sp.]